MNRRLDMHGTLCVSIWLLGLCVVGLLILPMRVDGSELKEAENLGREIDALLLARIEAEGFAAAPRSSDSEFVRRVYLDLIGVIPRVAEVREFLDDPRPDKRSRLIDELLDSPRYATHMANTWRQVMLPGGVDLQQLPSVAGVQNWLRRQFSKNLRYDRLVGDFLVATGGGDAGPALYYTSLELKPEKLAASTSRIFLGLRIECAECHDHPFDKWTQSDFWGYAAFFAQLDQSGAMNPNNQSLVDIDVGDVTLPETETVVLPKYPAGQKAKEADGGTRRRQLAIWMASRDNPFLGRAAVNRIWAQLFGRGLVEPVDDLGKHNPPSHPEVMDALTDYFVNHGFDLRELTRILAKTEAYQRSSRIGEDAPPPELFSHMAIKTLSAEQLYDSLQRVLMRSSRSAPSLLPAAQGAFDPQRLAFISKMQMRGVDATEFDAGVLQALTLLNGNETSTLTNFEQSGILQALSAPWWNDSDRVETLFLATLARLPSEEESKQFTEHLQQSESSGPDSQEVPNRELGDILWALLNSAEFVLNH